MSELQEINELVQYAKGFKNSYPDKFYQIWELIELCIDEIEQGGSPTHEIELCKESIKQLEENEQEN
jgi:transcription elongation factor GreA-like protein